jgi:hypothetical protein
MQRSIEALRQESLANRQAVARLTQALAEAQSSPPGWLWAALAALGGLCAVLLMRLRRLQGHAGPVAWWTTGAAVPIPATGANVANAATESRTEVLSPGGPASDSESTLPRVQPEFAPLPAQGAAPVSARDGSLGALSPADGVANQAEAQTANSAPDVLEVQEPAPVAARASDPSHAPDALSGPDPGDLPSVSVDELLDLQHQVDFFQVLGQEDAALKLLAEHLRLTRGNCPLPHLQLMDMYRRRGDQPAFERVRGRFQSQFDVAWPDWSQGPQAPHHLEDAPNLLLDVERAWRDPTQAMGVLEALLREAGRLDSLDPAVQSDLLFLFTLARDLHERPVRDSSPVTGLTSALPELTAVSPPAVDARDTAQPPRASPVDLDLEFPSGNALDLDLPLDMGAPDAVAKIADVPQKRAAAQQVQALPVIDLPLPGAESGLSGSAVPAVASTGGRSSQNSADLDLTLDEPWDAGASLGKPSPASAEPALSLEFPDLELSSSTPGPDSPVAAGVDIELSFDEPEGVVLATPLSVGEKRAASRFSLFSEEMGPAKRR